MAAVNNSMHAYAMPFHRPQTAAPAASVATSATTTATASDSDDGFSFGDLLDIINPLQHIPVVGTLYRKITGDQIGTPEKIAGDTLFGGIPGLIGSLADTAFEAITGKNVGDTVLGWFDGDDDKPTAVAANTPKTTIDQPQPGTLSMAAPTLLASADPAPALFTPVRNTQPEATAAPTALSGDVPLTGTAALMAALRDAKMDPELARRAAYAYSRATDLSQPLPTDALPDASLLTP